MGATWERITACGLYPAARLAGPDPGSPPDEKQIETCRTWLRLFATRTKSLRRRLSSYAYKHAVEDWTRRAGSSYEQTDDAGRRWAGPYLYIANGAFIEAARREGYRVEPASPGSPNACFDFAVARERRRAA